MRILITGAKGQLGISLQITDPHFHETKYIDFPDLDITINDSIYNIILAFSPDLIINCAAYTNVEQAEIDSDSAFKVNKNGIENLVDICNSRKIKLISISTDYVFGNGFNSPIFINSERNPLNIYGLSKKVGEDIILNNCNEYQLIRTSWLYSPYGKNFVKTIIGLLQLKPEIKIVNDQVGAPTDANNLAEFIWFSIAKNLSGVFQYSDSGIATWYDFAVAIKDLSKVYGKFHTDCKVLPTPSSTLNFKAKRPSYSCMDISKAWECGFKIEHWRHSLEKMLTRFFV